GPHSTRYRSHSPGDGPMNPLEPFLTRRGLLRGDLAVGAVALFAPGAFAEQLARTDDQKKQLKEMAQGFGPGGPGGRGPGGRGPGGPPGGEGGRRVGQQLFIWQP